MKKKEKQKAKSLREDGGSLREIASELGVSKSTVSRWLNEREDFSPKRRVMTDELREKYRQGAIKGNKKRKLQKKPFEELSPGRKRAALFDERGRRCEQCGWCEANPFSGIVPVQVHHIDGDRQNNTKENLMVLCPNCHSLTKKYMFHGQRHRGSYGKKGTVRYR